MNDPDTKRSRWITGVAAAAVAGLGGAITYVVLAPSPSERVQAALPPLPDLTSAVPTLRERLTRTYASVRQTGDLTALADYGRLLQANGMSTEAMSTWRLLIREEPTEGRWPYYLAHLYRDEGDMGETTALLQRTVEVSPTYAPAWLQLGDMALKSGKFAPARSFYQKRLQLEPGDPYARLGLARIGLQEDRQEEAMADLNALVTDHPQFASAHNLLSRLYRESGDDDRAEHHRWEGYQSGRFATAADPWMRELHEWCFTPERLFVIGMVDFQTNRGDRGRAAYERAVAVDPQDPGNRELLGDYYRKINEPELAREALGASLTLAESQGVPPPLLSFVNLAAIEREQGNFERSRKVAEAGISHHPRSPELRVEAGLTLHALGQSEAAFAAFQQALELSPNDSSAHFHIGEMLLANDQFDSAMTAFQAALVQQPTFALALRYLLEHALFTNRFEEAGEYADTLLKAYWGDPEVRQLVAIYHLRRGRAELAAGATRSAITQFNRGFKLNPEDADLAFELGTLQLAQANPRAAIAPLEVLLEKRPADPRAHLFLAQAYLMDGHSRRAQSLLETGLILAEQSGETGTAANIREMLNAIRR